MSKVVKGITKAVKKVVKGVTKAFKSVLKSPLGKALLIGATVYLGGAALGYWQSPFASINGALTGAGAGAAESAAAAALEGGGAAGAAGATGTAAATGAAEAAAAGAGAAGGAGSAATAAELAASAGNITGAVSTGAGAAKTGGLIASAMKNPLTQYALIQAGAGALEGAFSPNEVDILREQQRIREEEIARQNQNYNVGGIDVGRPGTGGSAQATPKQAPPPGFMYDQFGNLVPQPLPQQPRGFINTAMAR